MPRIAVESSEGSLGNLVSARLDGPLSPLKIIIAGIIIVLAFFLAGFLNVPPSA